MIADEFTTDVTKWAIDDVGVYVENLEWIYALLDAKNRILAGIKSDGSVEWSIGIPTPVKTYIDNAIAEIKNGTEGTDLDGLNEIIAFLSEFSTSDTLKDLLDTKVDKEEGKSLVDADYADSVQAVEDAEFLHIEADEMGHLLSGRRNDGTLVENIGIESPTIDNIYEELNRISEKTTKIICWGDSLTAGSGSGDTTGFATFCASLVSMGYPDCSSRPGMNYETMLSILLGEDYIVTNCGVGGETIYTISARQGGNPACLNNEIILPMSAGQEVAIVSGTNVSLLSTFDREALVRPLIQGNSNKVNPVYVNGIECTLRVVATDYQPSAYYISRNSNGDRNVTLPQYTPIIMCGSKLNTIQDIAIIWCGQNGGYNDTFMDRLKNMVKHLKNNKYLIIGVHSGTLSNRNEYESLLEKEFGDKYFNWRRYVSTNALYDFGFTPTADDLTAMSVGSIPPTLLHDSVHLNAAGYGILGFKIYEIFNEIGYIKN